MGDWLVQHTRFCSPESAAGAASAAAKKADRKNVVENCIARFVLRWWKGVLKGSEIKDQMGLADWGLLFRDSWNWNCISVLLEYILMKKREALFNYIFSTGLPREDTLHRFLATFSYPWLFQLWFVSRKVVITLLKLLLLMHDSFSKKHINNHATWLFHQTFQRSPWFSSLTNSQLSFLCS